MVSSDAVDRARPVRDVVAWSRGLVEPALREAVDALPAALRLVAGYHRGWWDERGHRPLTAGELAWHRNSSAGEFRKQRDRAKLAKEQTDASLQVEQGRRELVEGLRDALRKAPAGDLEWIAFRKMLAALRPLVPQAGSAVIAFGYHDLVVDFRGLYASYGKNLGYNRGEWVEAAPRMVML